MIKVTLRSLADRWPSPFVARRKSRHLAAVLSARSTLQTLTRRARGLRAVSDAGARWPTLSISLLNGLTPDRQFGRIERGQR